MDREAILEDFREWLSGYVEAGQMVSPHAALEMLEILEERYE